MRLRQCSSVRGLIVWMLAPLFFHCAAAQHSASARPELTDGWKNIDIVYIGDSITYGAGLPDPNTQSPPILCTKFLRDHFPRWNFFISNQGKSGHTTVDTLPAANLDFPDIERAAKELEDGHPGLLVFSIMLGTNDSAQDGPNGSPVTAEKYGDNLRAMMSRLLVDYPGSLIIINRPIWYSPNTHNGATYDEPGLERLQTYFPVITSVVHSFSSTANPVYEGDSAAFEYFASHYQSDLQPEDGQEGTFYLHPNVQGAQTLGQFWSSAIAHALELQGGADPDHPTSAD